MSDNTAHTIRVRVHIAPGTISCHRRVQACVCEVDFLLRRPFLGLLGHACSGISTTSISTGVVGPNISSFVVCMAKLLSSSVPWLCCSPLESASGPTRLIAAATVAHSGPRREATPRSDRSGSLDTRRRIGSPLVVALSLASDELERALLSAFTSAVGGSTRVRRTLGSTCAIQVWIRVRTRQRWGNGPAQ
jgi:hypothetical protein